MQTLVAGVQGGANRIICKVHRLLGGRRDDKKGMEILQIIVVAAVVAIICGVTLPLLSDTLQDSNDSTINAITDLTDSLDK